MNTAACFNSSEERELARFFARMLSDYSLPCALFSRAMLCVYSNNGFIKEGANLYEIANEPFRCPAKDFQSINVMIDGLSFCAMVFPVAMKDDDVKMYLCLLMDPENSMSIWVKSNAGARIRKAAYALREEASALYAAEDKLKSMIDDKTDQLLNRELWEMKKCSLNIGAAIENMIFYLQSYMSSREPVLIDVARFTEVIVNRCNTILAECGRAVELYCDETDMLIKGNSEMAVVSLVNALRNALMYSPKDTSPLLTVFKEKSGNDGEYIVFKLSNECDIMTSGSGDNILSMDFMYQRSGLGVHIIRSFADECNGDVSLSFEGKRAVLIMRIPAAKPKPDEFHSHSIAVFDDGRPDFLERFMRQVVNLFGNGQYTVTKKSE